jgi:hypothetical protein
MDMQKRDVLHVYSVGGTTNLYSSIFCVFDVSREPYSN